MMSLLLTVGLLAGSALVIYLACEFFVNGVEWGGRKLSMGQKATGTILAAFGTALPESAITFVAVAFGRTPAQKDLGVGAALGGPLALATLAYAVVGLMLIARSRHIERTPDNLAYFRHLSRDQAWFLVVFACKVGLGLVAFAYKPWLGLLFLAAYGAYGWNELHAGPTGAEDEAALEPLKLDPKAAAPRARWVAIQTLGSLMVILAASRVFVGQLATLGPALGLPPQLVALLVSPVATELPETLNAVIWLRQGKFRLALSNISGSMMIQATVPTAFGLFFTPWMLSYPLLLAASVTAATILVIYVTFSRGLISRRVLALVSLFYLAFVVLLARGVH